MSVLGFDLSTNNIHAAFIPKDNIIYCDVKNITYDDVTYNDVKNRNNKDGTMAAVSFQGKRRFVGRYATSMNNYYSDIMKVIGRSKLDLQFDPQLSYLLERGPNAQLLCVPDLMPDIRFTPTQLLAMVLSDLKSQAEIALRVDHVKECCIGIPAYFSESQCKAVRQAAQIAGFSNVSLVAAITATVLGHSIIRGQVIKQGIKVEKYIVIVDVDSDYMQIAVVSLKRQHLNVLTHVCHSSTGDVKVLLQNALTKADIKNDKIDKVLVTGSNIAAIESSLEDFFPKQEATAGAKVAGAKVAGAKVARTKVAGTKVDAAPDLVAKGCAILCAIRSESFKKHEFNHRLKSTQKFLVEFKVTDKWPPVSDEKTEVQVTQSSDDGRVVLTCQEMIDACTYESKMALREKLRMIIPAMLKLIEYATEAEVVELNNAKSQLDNDDLDDVYTNVRTIENNIRGRNDEHTEKLAMVAKLERKIVEIKRKLISAEPIYRTIKQTMKNKVKQDCGESIEWLNKQKEILACLPKNEGPISFIQNTDKHIEYLELAFEAAMLEREPEIVKLTYTVTKGTFLSIIDDFRTQLLKGTNAKVILGCFLLPFQIEVGGVPFKWFQVTLHGRGSESTVLHVKHHNAYIMGFNNKDGQPYEMAPGNQDDKELGHKDGDLNPPPMICFTIAGAKEAGFKCDYVNVVNPEGKYSKDEVRKKLVEFMLGEDPWLNAIHVLHYHGSDPEHHKVCALCKAPYAVRRAFMCISVMLNECTRMDAMKEAVHAGFSGMKLEEY